MVTHLFQARQHRQDHATPAHVAAVIGARGSTHVLAVQLIHGVAHHRLVERRLFAREVAIDLVLDLFGQVLDHLGVRLEAAQDKGAHQATEPRQCLVILKALDRYGKGAPKTLQ